MKRNSKQIEINIPKDFLFPLILTDDKMQAYIPEKTKLSHDLVSLTYTGFCEYLENAGYVATPKLETYHELIKICHSPSPTLKENFIILKGRPFKLARDAVIHWLNPPNIPQDLIYQNIPFAKLYPARGSLPAKNVFGEPLPLEQIQKPGVNLILHPNFHLNKKNQIYSTENGQAILNGNHLDFSPIYKVTNLHTDELKKVHFPCSVHVLCDFAPPLDWIVDGDLIVDEFWTAYSVQVKGNVVAKKGIQTNFANDKDHLILVEGNLETKFIQNSSFYVRGNTKVDGGIENSLLIIGGDFINPNVNPDQFKDSVITLEKNK